MEPTHLIGPMATVLAIGSHDDNLLKVGDFWKMELRESASMIAGPPSGEEQIQNPNAIAGSRAAGNKSQEAT